MIKSKFLKRIIYFNIIIVLLTQYSVDIASAQSEQDNVETNDTPLNSDSPSSNLLLLFFIHGGQMVFW
jgi:hypothetical protein